ncbi:MAG TPA: hypothetical protein DDZ39_01235 [Flavobacteriaceae bacterium]|nr:hypothetical protein [Flavobacteriaceae bacterium]HBS12816.1 hypothetical protein [Flavobacteriaceae bacterium]
MFKLRCLLKTLSVSLLIFMVGCKSTYEIKPFSKDTIPLKPNYQNKSSWVVLPSDTTKLEADVFYIYPTLATSDKDLRWNIPITDSIQNAKIINTAVRFQASAWETSGKMYIPIYRQAHLRAYFKFEKGGKEALTLAYTDVKSAFEYYLKHYNHGRPIILASHSQGSTHTGLLLKDFFDDKPLQKQLVAAYIPGIGFKKDEFKTIKLMTEPNETGGFVSWNTYKRNHLPKSYEKWYKGKVATNPITWDATIHTKKEDHKGFLYSNGKLYKNALKIEVIDGIIWTTLPKFPHRLFALFKKNYHVGDINLFWTNIQQNSELRVKSWLEKHKN